MLTEARQTERQVHEVVHMWNLKRENDTNALTYKRETDSQIQKTNLWLPKVKGGGGMNKLGVWD